MKLMDLLPERYTGSAETVAFQEAFQPELDSLWAARNDLLLQLDPRTATWSLDLWESAFGIPVDSSKDIEHRRTRVISKIRGSGTTTVALIKSVSESFANGEVEVDEIYSEYRLEIRFVGQIGIPPNLEDLRTALQDIIPAHLAWEFIINYFRHEQLRPYTHGELAAFAHNAIREGDLTNNGN